MPQGWPASSNDTRTFADLQVRLILDLNRPDIPEVVQQYLQDAIRYYQRRRFFFSDADNTAVPGWSPNLFYTVGATLRIPAQSPSGIPAAPWQATHIYAVGDQIVDSNGNIQRATTAGASSAVQPVWPVVAFATVTDTAVIWQLVSLWAPNHVFAAGDMIVDTNGNTQLAVVGGLSGATTPGWATTAYSQTQDNVAIWVLVSLAGTNDIVVVNLTAGTSGTTQPSFTQTLFTVPANLSTPPVFTPIVGTTPDNGCLWATAANWSNGIWTQLSTVPNLNQYAPPIDLVSLNRVEVTWSSNLRIGMTALPYNELRDYDVIRPTPPTTYPSFFSWYQQQIYLWPYPTTIFPVTLSYLSSPPMLVNASDANFWCQQAEALIRHYAAGRIWENVIHDAEAAQEAYDLAKVELGALISQRIQQNTGTELSGVPPSPW